jgi:hypothetical protein
MYLEDTNLPDMKRPATFWPKPVREGRLAHCRVLGDIISVPRVVPVLSLETSHRDGRAACVPPH